MRPCVPRLFGRFHGYESDPCGVRERENEAQEPPAPLLPARYRADPLRAGAGRWTPAPGGWAVGQGAGPGGGAAPQWAVPVGQEPRASQRRSSLFQMLASGAQNFYSDSQEVFKLLNR